MENNQHALLSPQTHHNNNITSTCTTNIHYDLVHK